MIVHFVSEVSFVSTILQKSCPAFSRVKLQRVEQTHSKVTHNQPRQLASYCMLCFQLLLVHKQNCTFFFFFAYGRTCVVACHAMNSLNVISPGLPCMIANACMSLSPAAECCLGNALWTACYRRIAGWWTSEGILCGEYVSQTTSSQAVVKQKRHIQEVAQTSAIQFVYACCLAKCNIQCSKMQTSPSHCNMQKQ